MKNKVALVTGGSSGIGKAIALRFAEEGAKVVIVGRNEKHLQEVSRLNKNIVYVAGDVTNSDVIKSIVEKIKKEFDSKLDILVAWSPLCADISKITNNQTICELAQKYGKTPAQIALKFLLQRDIYIITKSKNSKRLEKNLNLDFTINNKGMGKLKNLDERRSLFGWYMD